MAKSREKPVLNLRDLIGLKFGLNEACDYFEVWREEPPREYFERRGDKDAFYNIIRRIYPSEILIEMRKYGSDFLLGDRRIYILPEITILDGGSERRIITAGHEQNIIRLADYQVAKMGKEAANC